MWFYCIVCIYNFWPLWNWHSELIYIIFLCVSPPWLCHTFTAHFCGYQMSYFGGLRVSCYQTEKFGFTEFSNGIGRNCGMLCFYQMSTNIFLSDIHVANIWQKLLSQWSVIKFEQIPSLCRYNSWFYQWFYLILGGKDPFCSIFWKNWVKSWRNHK